MKKYGKGRKRALYWTGVAVLFLLILIIGQSRALWKWLYPFPYQEVIYREAERYHLDPLLVAAVIHTESKFNPRARSEKGAIGLMQLMPETARWAASQLQLGSVKEEDLLRPELNIKLGCWYINQLAREFNGDMIIVLAAYNGGSGNVRKWLEKEKWSGQHSTIDDIPFPETRAYVKKTLRAYEIYQILYAQK
ncbi:soluble lytic murein transglycosylase [Carboxydocella sporoproducens DSM 16521]|uniref:Soluble lytic murein transglycosylase n=2 Tax=Carboxydocella TaxID=178898 RepID=A0A1T4L9L7_9FIRM|nr:soluble lytic murein transglycosylase [Carboxydocella thermautotrophica]SJZ51445.1 soluble lytic murein transglycosylase [Carboxydocella sporoproducens DSM 16521]